MFDLITQFKDQIDDHLSSIINKDKLSDLVNQVQYHKEMYSTYLVGSYLQTMQTLKPVETFYYRGKDVIVLVPGLFCTASVMNHLGRNLYEKGFDIFIPPNFPYYFGALANICDLNTAAKLFRSFVEELNTKHEIQKVHVVGHSNGAIIPAIAMDLAVKQNGSKASLNNMMQGIISMAAPFFGAPIAGLIKYFVPQARNIYPGSPSLQGIDRYKKYYKYNLVSGFDAIVPPENQKFPDKEYKVFENFQHMDFVVGTPDKIEAVASEIVNIIRGGNA